MYTAKCYIYMPCGVYNPRIECLHCIQRHNMHDCNILWYGNESLWHWPFNYAIIHLNDINGSNSIFKKTDTLYMCKLGEPLRRLLYLASNLEASQSKHCEDSISVLTNCMRTMPLHSLANCWYNAMPSAQAYNQCACVHKAISWCVSDYVIISRTCMYM